MLHKHYLPDGSFLVTYDKWPTCAEYYAAGRDPAACFAWPDRTLLARHIMLPSETTYDPDSIMENEEG